MRGIVVLGISATEIQHVQEVDVLGDSHYQASPRAVYLCQTKPLLGMQQLAVKIGKLDGISVHEANLSDPGTG